MTPISPTDAPAEPQAHAPTNGPFRPGNPAPPDEKAGPAPSVPSSVITVARRSPRWPWVIPVLALLACALLLYQVRTESGRIVRVHFHFGDGIQTNDPVTYRGVQVGHVRSVTISPDLASVIVAAELRPDAGSLAVQGSQFWIVRPEVSLTRVSGLETLLGPRHLEVEPGPPNSRPVAEFNGLDRAPPRIGRTFVSGTGQQTSENAGGVSPAGLELSLQAGRLGSITAASPVLFRGIHVGAVTAVRLAEDARTVDLTVVIEPQYARLVRGNTRFWNAGGLGLDFGLIRGLTVNAKSLESILTGGIEFATPNKPGGPAEPGHRFKLEDEAEKAWLEWAPAL